MTTSPSRSSRHLLEALLDLVAQLALGVARARAPPRSRRRRGSAAARRRAPPAPSRRARGRSRRSSWRRSEWPRTTPWTSSSSSIGGADLAGERALGRLVHVLREDLDARAARRVDHRACSAVNGAQIATSTPSARETRGSSACDELLGLRDRLVHLPVARDERGARHHDSRTSTPGSVLPSISSSDAPPPVERWSTRSASPNCAQRRGAVAAADDRRARRRRDRLGDRARAGRERLELERAHRAVPEDACRRRAITLARSAAAVRGADVEAHPAVGDVDAVELAALGVGREARRRARGRSGSSSLPPAARRRARARPGSMPSSSHSESPTAWPWAAKNGKHIAPPIEDRVGALEERLDHADLVGHLRAADDRDERPLRVARGSR